MTSAGPENHLTSWTRTLNVEDAFALLDVANPGMSVRAWMELGDTLLPQTSQARRTELLRIVRTDLLDTAHEVIVQSSWLRLFQGGSPHRRSGLFFGRLWRKRPLIAAAIDTLILPALANTDRPLSPHDSDLVPHEAWDTMLRKVLHPDVPHEAFTKTRSTLQAAFRDVGVLELLTSPRRTTRVRHARPDPLAFAWVLAHELAELRDQAESWALHSSFAARLFAPRPDYVALCIEHGLEAGLLTRNYLMAQARLHPGPAYLTQPLTTEHWESA